MVTVVDVQGHGEDVDVNQIVEEVLQHPTGLTDTDVEITLEIKARRLQQNELSFTVNAVR